MLIGDGGFHQAHHQHSLSSSRQLPLSTNRTAVWIWFTKTGRVTRSGTQRCHFQYSLHPGMVHLVLIAGLAPCTLTKSTTKSQSEAICAHSLSPCLSTNTADPLFSRLHLHNGFAYPLNNTDSLHRLSRFWEFQSNQVVEKRLFQSLPPAIAARIRLSSILLAVPQLRSRHFYQAPLLMRISMNPTFPCLRLSHPESLNNRIVSWYERCHCWRLSA